MPRLGSRAPAARQALRVPARERADARGFAPGGQGIGFAVLGGAFVASLGMSQHNEANEIMRERMQALFGDGYEYTYVYPGLQKVVQAAGRVIRSEEDAGVLYLLGDRFARQEIRALLPGGWHVQPLHAQPLFGRAEAGEPLPTRRR